MTQRDSVEGAVVDSAAWSPNPFVGWMSSLINPDVLRELLTSTASPIVGLDTMPAHAAGDHLRQLLEDQPYVPTDCSLDLAMRILSAGYAYALTAYPDKATFIAKSSSNVLKVRREPTTWLITGLAGIGKSSLLRALMNCLHLRTRVHRVSDQCPPRRILGGIFITVTSKSPKKESLTLISDALGIDCSTERVTERQIEMIRLELYRQGVLFIVADEIQSQSGGMTTGVAYVNYLGFLRSLGVPVIRRASR